MDFPPWLWWITLGLSFLWLWEKLIWPLFSHFARSRGRRLVERMNQRLALRLAPFKLAKKRSLEQALIHDPEVLRTAETFRQEEGLSWREVEKLLARYAREIVPTFNVYLYYKWGYLAAKALVQAFYKVRVGFLDKRALSAVKPEDSVVFLMNHRSNFDYLLLAYIVRRHASIAYAVGEWARVWPLDALIRRLGGFFVRRNNPDKLYRKVLERFVQLAAAGGVTQGVFPEGRLTRDGALGPPKLGLLHYLLKWFDPAGEHDLVFIPVGLNYDRVLEDRAHVEQGMHPRRLRRSLHFVFRLLRARLVGRKHLFGYASVLFGRPISAKALVSPFGDVRRLPEAEYRNAIATLGQRLMERIAEAVPATPVSVLALAWERAFSRGEVASLHHVEELVHALSEKGNLVPHLSPGELFHSALRTLMERRAMVSQGSTFRPPPEQETLLRFYANSIRHLLRG